MNSNTYEIQLYSDAVGELSKSGFKFPADRTINRVLKREGLIKKNSLCAQGR